ncbi:MAG TPA: BTAD domain-containing putative transcriptional regulator, partial [Chloroflexota bacterium]|nr:BTAD domain-containing putative transcriptional regulator [Chloroflexota bacterium]
MRSRYLGKQAPPAALVAGEPRPVPLRIQSLGGFAIWRGEKRVPVQTWGSRMRALFAVLLLSVDQPRTRAQIADALWPDLAPAAAAKAVRQTLSRLRKVLDRSGQRRSYLPNRKVQVTIDPRPNSATPTVWWDAKTFASAAASALASRNAEATAAALTLYTGDYLPDLLGIDVIDAYRMQLREQYLALLVRHARLCAAQAKMEEAEHALTDILTHDPCHEDAARMLMAILGAAGRRAEALQVYLHLEAAQADELGVAPESDTRALRDRLASEAHPPVHHAEPTERSTNLPISASRLIGRG